MRAIRGIVPGVCALFLATTAMAQVTVPMADPPEAGFGAGDVFREYVTNTSGFIAIEDATDEGKPVPKTVTIDDLDHATRAEAVVAYWGGHIGTVDQRFTVNGSEPIDIPQPTIVPKSKQPPQAYFRTMLRAIVEIPLDKLKEGENTLVFTAGPQVFASFGWGFYWMYSTTIRVYYDPAAKPHPTGEIVSPKAGATIGEHPLIEVKASSPNGEVTQVDVVGDYFDFDWEGDGSWRGLHYTLIYGQIDHHIGTAVRAPWQVRWDTTWLADQDKPVTLLARIRDETGLIYVTQPRKVIFKRDARSVKAGLPVNVRPKFHARASLRTRCNLWVPFALDGATRARVQASTWSGRHGEYVGVNDVQIAAHPGRVHNYSFDAWPVKPDTLRKGVNTFTIYSETEHHGIEINWPGPLLLVEFGGEPAEYKPTASQEHLAGE